jgi:serine kinase of HPr protein (carbohydrate metabolism regulator)
MIVHASLIARRLDGLWRGALIEGPSGTGKSDLVLRCLGAGFCLVADDRVILFAAAGRLYGRAPDSLAGRLEVRGLGIVAAPTLAFASIAVVVRLSAAVERLPDPAVAVRLGVAIETARLSAFEASAPAKLAALLEALGRPRQEGYLAPFAPRGGRGGSPLRHSV